MPQNLVHPSFATAAEPNIFRLYRFARERSSSLQRQRGGPLRLQEHTLYHDLANPSSPNHRPTDRISDGHVPAIARLVRANRERDLR
jgi:hypothetical protein